MLIRLLSLKVIIIIGKVGGRRNFGEYNRNNNNRRRKIGKMWIRCTIKISLCSYPVVSLLSVNQLTSEAAKV